jgi:hypothetical protein
MNHTRFPKVLLPDWARRDKQGTKGDRVNRFEGKGWNYVNFCDRLERHPALKLFIADTPPQFQELRS